MHKSDLCFQLVMDFVWSSDSIFSDTQNQQSPGFSSFFNILLVHSIHQITDCYPCSKSPLTPMYLLYLKTSHIFYTFSGSYCKYMFPYLCTLQTNKYILRQHLYFNFYSPGRLGAYHMVWFQNTHECQSHGTEALLSQQYLGS